MDLHLDFETRSELDIKIVGLDRYARNSSALMLAWAINDAAPSVWFPSEGPLPVHLALLITRPEVRKVAWNAAFERAIFNHALGIYCPVEQWVDPSVMARYAGMPGHLSECSKFLGLAEKGKKDGARLIRKFSVPRRVTKKHPEGGFVTPEEAPADWAEFVDYCRGDVIAEREIFHRLSGAFSLPEQEERLWRLDSKINEAGVPVDVVFVENAQHIVNEEKTRLRAELVRLTGLENPGSVEQLTGWLRGQGYPYSSLAERRVTRALADPAIPSVVRTVLELRKKSSKSSTAKLETLAAQIGVSNVQENQLAL